MSDFVTPQKCSASPRAHCWTKSNTIGWLTHRLASLHDDKNARVFDSVVVITDRVVLDKQLQDTIYQFEHKHGVVQKIDENSRQLVS
jgi:type I restriction enzyme R subunit